MVFLLDCEDEVAQVETTKVATSVPDPTKSTEIS